VKNFAVVVWVMSSATPVLYSTGSVPCARIRPCSDGLSMSVSLPRTPGVVTFSTLPDVTLYDSPTAAGGSFCGTTVIDTVARLLFA